LAYSTAHGADGKSVTTLLAGSGSLFPFLVISIALSVIAALTFYRLVSKANRQEPLMIEPVDLRRIDAGRVRVNA
jgi:hypothetical protein